MDEKWYFVVFASMMMLTLGVALGTKSRPFVAPQQTKPFTVAVIEVWDVPNGTYTFSKTLENTKNYAVALSFSVEPEADLTCSFDGLGPLEHREASFTLTVTDPIPQTYVIDVEGVKHEG